MLEILCLCQELTPTPLAGEVVLVSHVKEIEKTTNTGRLALLALTPTRQYIHGLKSPPPLPQLRHQPLVLSPTPEAEPLSPEWRAAHPGPYSLLVPDGSWRQAMKMTHRMEFLRQAKPVSIVPRQQSNYCLRREPKPEGLATFEAIAYALSVLESQELASQLLTLFHKFVARTLWSRAPSRPLSMELDLAAIDAGKRPMISS